MAGAQFVTRSACINCGSKNVGELSSGSFHDEPLHDFLAADPWGENPIPFLEGQRWSYVKCRDCTQAFHARILSPEWNEIKFVRWMTAEAIADFHEIYCDAGTRFNKAVHFTKHALQIEYLTRALRATDPVRVLDFGCGNGEFLAICALYGFEASGIDRSSARRDKAGPDIVATVEELDRSSPFHAITLFEVLEHVDDPGGILRMLRELLIPGGILVLETPDCSGVTTLASRHDYALIHPLDHINGFTPTTLRSIAGRIGFQPIRAPLSQVTCSPARVAKTEAKRFLQFALRDTTQQYFRLGLS